LTPFGLPAPDLQWVVIPDVSVNRQPTAGGVSRRRAVADRHLGGGGDRFQRGDRGCLLRAHHGERSSRVLDHRRGESGAHVRIERRRLGRRRDGFVPRRDADHGRVVRAVEGEGDLERAVRGRVAAVLLVLAGGTTWASDGMWAPDGVYSRVVSPIIALVWIAVFSGLLQARSPSTVRVPESSVATPASVL
jgi:hypothetical protein